MRLSFPLLQYTSVLLPIRPAITTSSPEVGRGVQLQKKTPAGVEYIRRLRMKQQTPRVFGELHEKRRACCEAYGIPALIRCHNQICRKPACPIQPHVLVVVGYKKQPGQTHRLISEQARRGPLLRPQGILTLPFLSGTRL